jgi:hypothetical protein
MSIVSTQYISPTSGEFHTIILIPHMAGWPGFHSIHFPNEWGGTRFSVSSILSRLANYDVSTQYISPTSGEIINQAQKVIESAPNVSTQYISPTSGEQPCRLIDSESVIYCVSTQYISPTSGEFLQPLRVSHQPD